MPERSPAGFELQMPVACSWHGKSRAWALITLLGHSVCCAPSPMPRRKCGLLMALLHCKDECRIA